MKVTHYSHSERQQGDGAALVRAGDFVTRYVRRGSGLPVIALGRSDDEPRAWTVMQDELARHCRVISPEVPAPDERFAEWLTAFLDGVGLAAVAVLATDGWCMAAIEFALRDPERVLRLALIPGGITSDNGLRGDLSTDASVRGVPLLVIHRSNADVVSSVTTFMLGEGDPG